MAMGVKVYYHSYHIKIMEGKAMRNINWLVRAKNKTFWITLIPAVIVLIQTIAAVFGFTIDLSELGNNLVNVVNAVFVVLAILGIVIDPTTAGAGDSENAMTYTEPKA